MDKNIFLLALKVNDVLKMISKEYGQNLSIGQNDFNSLDEDDFGRYRHGDIEDMSIVLKLHETKLYIDFKDYEEEHLIIEIYEPKPWTSVVTKKAGGIDIEIKLLLDSSGSVVEEKLKEVFKGLVEELSDEGFKIFNMLSDKKGIPYAKDIYEELIKHINKEDIIWVCKNVDVNIVKYEEKIPSYEKQEENLFLIEFVEEQIYIIYHDKEINLYEKLEEAEKLFIEKCLLLTEKLYDKKIKEKFSK